jgi:hypothetical protein
LELQPIGIGEGYRVVIRWVVECRRIENLRPKILQQQMEPVDVLSALRFKREMMESGCVTVMSLAPAPGFGGAKAH